MSLFPHLSERCIVSEKDGGGGKSGSRMLRGSVTGFELEMTGNEEKEVAEEEKGPFN